MTNARTLGNIGRNADLEDGGGLVPLATNGQSATSTCQRRGF